MIGANDITKPNGIGPSARRLGRAVRRLRASGAVVVVGTCPDFGVITGDSRSPCAGWPAAAACGSRDAQAGEVRAAGGIPVPFSDLLAPEFYKAPEVLFSHDMFHPSAAGYSLAAKQLLPALCNALGDVHHWHADRGGAGVAVGRRRVAARQRLGGLSAAVAALDRGPRADRGGRELGSLQ